MAEISLKEKMSPAKYPVLNRLLGSGWLSYMVECETLHRPSDNKKISYIGNLAELEKALGTVEKRLQTDPKFPILIDHLKAGRDDEGWEKFEHAFAIAKELEKVIRKHPREPLELFPTTGSNELDFRLKIEGQWIYFELKASPMFSFEGEFLHADIEERISQKIQHELNSDFFYIICFTDLKPRVDADAFFEYLKTATETIHKRKNQNFPVLLKFPDSQPRIEVLVVNRQKPLKKPPWVNDENWMLIKSTVKYSIEVARGKNHCFNHFAPIGYNLKKRLKNLLGHAANQMHEKVPNVLILYTREVVLGGLNEVYTNCESLFTEEGYTIIDALAINVEYQTCNLTRRLFERQGSKLPIRIGSLV